MKHNLIDVSAIVTLQAESIAKWEGQESPILTQKGFLKLVEENHSFNVQLWKTEDKARRDDMGYQYVYEAKRRIDGFNQQRNNRMEAMDSWLYEKLAPSEDASCPRHSETPGMIIDRLSILALKIYHMALQVERQDVDAVHRQNCQQKFDTLLLQQERLADCLNRLVQEVIDKTRTFAVYHQFKMYNDPKLNPELYLQDASKA